MKMHLAIVSTLAVLLLAGCTAFHARYQREQARLSAIHAAAGKPVSSFNYMATTMYSWEPLNEHELLVYTRPNQAWLLNVGLCPQLPYTVAIGLTSHVGQVSTMLDSVLVGGSSFPCTIQKIQPVDVGELKQRMQARKGAKIVPAPASSA
ncbi:MAG TPA: DUF6491 family protein [Oleiagrimonas sp.]|nr:DUF6491 family protein [Oleiagrimonas sp.]